MTTWPPAGTRHRLLPAQVRDSQQRSEAEGGQFQEHNPVPQYREGPQVTYSLFANWLTAMLGGKVTPPQVAQNLQNPFE